MQNVKLVPSSKLRLKSSIALYQESGCLHFFKTNTRESFYLSFANSNIDFIEILQEFDGNNTTEQIAKKNNLELSSLISLLSLLVKNHIIIIADAQYDDLHDNYRLINFLEDFFISSSQINKKLKDVKNKTVLIVGLGAVGSFVVDILARSGIENFIIADDDVVDITNIHRQNMYFEDDVGMLKTDCIERELLKINSNISVLKLNTKMDDNFFTSFDSTIDLAINCADYPSVDFTSKIIADYCMKFKIPHIIGGGYNLHLTLIGQSILPFKSSCFYCFETELNKINGKYTKHMKKLVRKNRKIGSFSPLCSLSASLTALESFKILYGLEDKLVNLSKRIEFKIRNMDLEILEIPRDKECFICKENNNVNKRN